MGMIVGMDYGYLHVEWERNIDRECFRGQGECRIRNKFCKLMPNVDWLLASSTSSMIPSFSTSKATPNNHTRTHPSCSDRSAPSLDRRSITRQRYAAIDANRKTLLTTRLPTARRFYLHKLYRRGSHLEMDGRRCCRRSCHRLWSLV